MDKQKEIAELEQWIASFEEQRRNSSDRSTRKALELEAAALRRKIRTVQFERG